MLVACSAMDTSHHSQQAIGMANPASVYCEKIGGQTMVKKDSTGAEAGYCRLKDGQVVDEWALYRQHH